MSIWGNKTFFLDVSACEEQARITFWKTIKLLNKHNAKSKTTKFKSNFGTLISNVNTAILHHIVASLNLSQNTTLFMIYVKHNARI
jgi:hypothetical protein